MLLRRSFLSVDKISLITISDRINLQVGEKSMCAGVRCVCVCVQLQLKVMLIKALPNLLC